MLLDAILALPLAERIALAEAEGLLFDYFAGGGGASEGIKLATGRSPDVAKNHDPEALALHERNHPETWHIQSNIWKGDPRDEVREASRRKCARYNIPFRILPVRGWWFSPDCKHFSKAKGSKPVEKGIRDLAWVVVHVTKLVKVEQVWLENVEEFKDWGPLVATADGKLVPCPLQKGLTFKRWKRELRRNGARRVEERELRAFRYGAPTIRKRLFVIVRFDDQPIVWPAETHEKPDAQGAVGAGKRPWRTAAECIDWSLECPSIFTRARPLAENTLRRVARGVMRYVVNAEKPFIVGVGGRMGQSPERPVDVPMQTGTAKADSAIVEPFIVGAGGPAFSGKPVSGDQPMGVQTTENHRAVVAAIARIGQTGGGGKYVNDAREPLTTATSKAEHLVVAAHITKFRGGATGSGADEPVPTVTANSFIKRPGGAAPLGLVAATLIHRGNGEREGQAPRAMDIQKPLNTVVASGIKHAVVAAFMAQHNTGNDGHDAREPLSTIVGKGCTQGVVEARVENRRAALLTHAYTSNTAGGNGSLEVPTKTILTGGHTSLVELDLSSEDLAGAQRVAAFIAKYYGQGIGQEVGEPLHTATTKERFALVTVNGWPIVDIGLRMLQPRELYRAQGFGDDYVIDGPGPAIDGKPGKPLTKTAQVRMCGNSVCPPVAAAIVRANLRAPVDMPDVKAAD